MSRARRITALALSAATGAVGHTTAAVSANAATPSTQQSHGRLVFQTVLASTNRYALATMDSSGGDFTPITLSGTAPGFPSLPVFSHDGKHMAFLGDVNGSGQYVYVANADGSGSHVIAQNPDQWHGIDQVVWSADDSTLYLGFLVDVNTEPLQIWQIGVDGTGLRPFQGSLRHPTRMSLRFSTMAASSTTTDPVMLSPSIRRRRPAASSTSSPVAPSRCPRMASGSP